MAAVADAKRLVIKIGSALLVDRKTGQLRRDWLVALSEDVARLRVILDDMHSGFIDWVKSRRGDKLTAGTDLFTGDVWLGARAQEMGLIDGLAHLEPKMKELYGDKVRFARYGRRRSLFQRLGATLTQDALAGLEERAAYARFGL